MKKSIKIIFVLSLISILFLLSFGQGLAAQSEKLWPKGTPIVTVGFSAGGGTDTAVRPILAKMEEYLGETINVVNMEGASSAVAAEHVLSNPADGYNMFATGSGPLSGFRVMGTSNTSWRDWIGWHPFNGPAALLVKDDSPIKTFDEAVKALKVGDLNFGISGFGVGPHVLGEAIFAIAGIPSPNYVTAGSCRNAAVALYAGEVDIAMCTFSAAVDFVKAGQLRALAVTTSEPYTVDNIVIPSITSLLEGSENVPLLSETWPVLIRRGTPQEIIDKLNEAFVWAIAQPEIKEFADTKALNIVGYYGEEADKFLSFSEAGYAWALYNSGLAEKSPEEFGIPKLADWDWEKEKNF
ncbi:MAG TPA: tripartite tricarboxylate transporter substrate binding protein [Anaerovoracaceae bacterium]|nr:tripartite tricarboxylate transporter substrate binding protein [Anaerovoracaceae bacterium]